MPQPPPVPSPGSQDSRDSYSNSSDPYSGYPVGASGPAHNSFPPSRSATNTPPSSAPSGERPPSHPGMSLIFVSSLVDVKIGFLILILFPFYRINHIWYVFDTKLYAFLYLSEQVLLLMEKNFKNVNCCSVMDIFSKLNRILNF